MKQSSKQALLQVVKEQIRDLEHYERLAKEEVQYYWHKAVSGDLVGNVNFVALNDMRTSQRKIKNKIKALSMLAKELKLNG